MAGTRSFEYEQLLNVLTHEWKTAEAVILQITPMIPRGTAIRAYKDRSLSKGIKRYTEDEQFQMGARHLINVAIGTASTYGRIVVRNVTGSRNGRELRRNEFDAEYIDALLKKLAEQSAPAAEATEEVVEEVLEPDPVVSIAVEPSVEIKVVTQLTTLEPILFDHRNIQKDVKVVGIADHGQVQMTITEVARNGDDNSPIDLNVFMTPAASDWLSDQLGFSALIARNGIPNPRKAYQPGQLSTR